MFVDGESETGWLGGALECSTVLPVGQVKKESEEEPRLHREELHHELSPRSRTAAEVPFAGI